MCTIKINVVNTEADSTRCKQDYIRKDSFRNAVQMALDLVENRKGELYRSTVKDHFKRRPPYLEQIVHFLGEINSDYPERFTKILDIESE